MLARARRSPTFANVTSLLALTVALGTGGAYAADTVFSTDIVDGEVRNADLAADSVSTTKIIAGSVNYSDLAAGVITSAKIADGSIAAVDLAAGSVGSAAIGTAVVGTSEIATGGVQGADIATDSVGPQEISPSAVGAPEIATGGVGAAEIATGGVGALEIADGAVDGGEVVDESLTVADLRGGTRLTTISIPAGLETGRCTAFDYDVPGARVGHAVAVGMSGNAPLGYLVQGRVTGVDEVLVELCNLRGADSFAVAGLDLRLVTVD